MMGQLVAAAGGFGFMVHLGFIADVCLAFMLRHVAVSDSGHNSFQCLCAGCPYYASYLGVYSSHHHHQSQYRWLTRVAYCTFQRQ